MGTALTQPLATLLAGSLVVVGAVVAFASAALGRRQAQLHFAAQHELDRERELRDRYTSAATQIGNKESAAVRLAGVYGLAGLADDWLLRDKTVNAQMAIDLLRGYLRVAPTGDDSTQEQEVRKTIILEMNSRSHWWADASDSIAPLPSDSDKHPRTSLLNSTIERAKSARSRIQRFGEPKSQHRSSSSRRKAHLTLRAWAHMNTDLDRAWLAGADLGEIRIAGVHFADANMRSTILTGDVELAWMPRASLVDAHLCDLYARHATLEHADLTGADVRGANLGEANLDHAILIGANLVGTILDGASLRGANLAGAILDGHNLEKLEARGAVLHDPDWRCSCHPSLARARTHNH